MDMTRRDLIGLGGLTMVGAALSPDLAARLNDVAGCDEVVVSNTLYQRLPDAARADFLALAPVEAKNIGRIRAWRRGPPRAPLA